MTVRAHEGVQTAASTTKKYTAQKSWKFKSFPATTY